MKHSLFVVFTIIVISLTSSACPTHPVYMDARLDGPLNIVPDSFYMERSKEYRFASVNFNFGDEMSVSLPLVETDKVDMGGKTLLDEDLDQDSLTKSDSLYRKSIEDADGTYILSTKDSLRIIAPSHPLHGIYKITFFKVKRYAQEHYSCVCQMIRHTSFARSSSLVGTLMAIYLKIGRNEKKTKEYG